MQDRDEVSFEGYLSGQLAKALRAAETRDDRSRVEKWLQALSGVMKGVLSFGSRTPVKDTPPWVTLEVLSGGFASGSFAAGGELRPHEQALAERLGVETRAHLNTWYVSDDGLRALQSMLVSGCYRVDVPEEGALLTVAWLMTCRHVDAARHLLEEIAPWFGTLRFYPRPHGEPLDEAETVRLQDVKETTAALLALRPRPQREVMRRSVEGWLPLYDRVVALFVETVRGGWPCQVWSEDWRARARSVLDEIERLGEPPGRRNFRILVMLLTAAVRDPRQLTGREVGKVRRILADIDRKRGLPGSERLADLRRAQAQQVNRPSREQWARLLTKRLASLPADGGIDDVDVLLRPPQADELAIMGGQVSERVPDRFRPLLMRCCNASLETLLEWRVIPSGEVLARVLPQLTSQVEVAGVSDLRLRKLHGAVYRAFRPRRSLLLLWLQKQVKLAELPWVRETEPYRETDVERARALLRDVVGASLHCFPHVILPNKLLAELRALARLGGLGDLPLVDELAADIFMGTFTVNFLRAARVAAEQLEGTLYARYYALPVAELRAIDDVKPSRHGPPTSEDFAALCRARAGLAGATGRPWVAENGKIIEQGQILTTHNLAVLTEVLGLRGVGNPQHCWQWICRALSQRVDARHARLHRHKKVAYAWRQMVYYLSTAPDETFLDWAENHLQQQKPAVTDALRPLLARLRTGQGPMLLGWVSEPLAP